MSYSDTGRSLALLCSIVGSFVDSDTWSGGLTAVLCSASEFLMSSWLTGGERGEEQKETGGCHSSSHKAGVVGFTGSTGRGRVTSANNAEAQSQERLCVCVCVFCSLFCADTEFCRMFLISRPSLLFPSSPLFLRVFVCV